MSLQKIAFLILLICCYTNTYSQKQEEKEKIRIKIQELKESENVAENKTLIEILETDLSDDYQIGSAYFEARNYDLAIESFIKALQEYPNNENIKEKIYSCYIFRGNDYQLIGKLQEAIIDFTRYLNYVTLKYGKPNGPLVGEVYYNRAGCFFELERWNQAITDYSEVIKMGFYLGNAYFLRGVCNLKLNNYTLACRDFKAALNNNKFESKEWLINYCE